VGMTGHAHRVELTIGLVPAYRQTCTGSASTRCLRCRGFHHLTRDYKRPRVAAAGKVRAPSMGRPPRQLAKIHRAHTSGYPTTHGGPTDSVGAVPESIPLRTLAEGDNVDVGDAGDRQGMTTWSRRPPPPTARKVLGLITTSQPMGHAFSCPSHWYLPYGPRTCSQVATPQRTQC
jgi:hypothetical protein